MIQAWFILDINKNKIRSVWIYALGNRQKAIENLETSFYFLYRWNEKPLYRN